MIKLPKLQSYKPYLSFLFLLIPLTGFFLYAIFIERSFFMLLAAGLLISLLFLVPLYLKLSRKQAETKLLLQDTEERFNLVQAEIAHEEAAIKSFRDKIINYSQLKGLTERLSMCLYLEDTSKTLSSEIGRLYGEEDTTIILYLFHSKTGELGISSSQKGQLGVNLKTKNGDLFDQWVVKTMQSLLIEDTKSDYRFDTDKAEMEEVRPIRSLISVPMVIGNKALGIIRIDSPKEGYFGTEDLRFLMTIGDLGAVAVENAQLYERVEQLAIKDGLTNLYLRRHLMQRMSEEINRQVRNKKELSFLMIDLDDFKKYNDRFGHTAGDIVLKTLSSILLEEFNQPGNIVCRFGGEEFAILLPDCNKDKAIELAEKMRKHIEGETIMLRREETKVTISVGVASFPTDARSKEELIQKADQALYEAKNKGRNNVVGAKGGTAC